MRQTLSIATTGTMMLISTYTFAESQKVRKIVIEFPADRIHDVVQHIKPNALLKFWKNENLLLDDSFAKVATPTSVGIYEISVAEVDFAVNDKVGVWLSFPTPVAIKNKMDVTVSFK